MANLQQNFVRIAVTRPDGGVSVMQFMTLVKRNPEDKGLCPRGHAGKHPGGNCQGQYPIHKLAHHSGHGHPAGPHLPQCLDG
jgi:hypothetical protein